MVNSSGSLSEVYMFESCPRLISLCRSKKKPSSYKNPIAKLTDKPQRKISLPQSYPTTILQFSSSFSFSFSFSGYYFFTISPITTSLAESSICH
ncbi:hypothetical protein QVD17_07035 [Tagetes erecta]|uniref:Uncharacterized protein n=1 Tax=Tagetes erecta TaxID=13708 RepID=A0AAD8LFD3_TARER|nr:hypothetical protein QVD17_07035 [Tagetes erecta]